MMFYGTPYKDVMSMPYTAFLALSEHKYNHRKMESESIESSMLKQQGKRRK